MAVCVLRSLSLPIPPNSGRRRHHTSPPLILSTNPADLDLVLLHSLFLSSNYSPLRFPDVGPSGLVAPVALERLRLAVSNSSVVVSAFVGEHEPELGLGLGGFVMRMVGRTASGGRLVGSGRAVSDGALTASIHDVVVEPSLRRMGIGRKIVNKIIRLLTNRGIYDISALCSDRERMFFESCGFGEDSLGSTTMMYCRPAPDSVHDDTTARRIGRLLLLVPPLREAL